MLSVIVYSVFTAACGLAQDFRQLLAARVFLGFGMGGEWASGAALVSESWAAEHRGKALGLMQSGWAVGYAAAALVNGLIQPAYGWRAVFFVGILPAFLTIWIRRRVEEPPIWRSREVVTSAASGIRRLFERPLARLTIALTFMNACTLFAWWGFYLWLPSYLVQPVSQGGVGLQLLSSSGFILVMQSGMWVGYVTFGFVSDALGRKPTYVVYLIMAAALLTVFLSTRNAMLLLALGPFVAFFATGYFSGFGAVTAEIYPTAIRATAQGFTYNIGRLASALAPFTVGTARADARVRHRALVVVRSVRSRGRDVDLDPGNKRAEFAVERATPAGSRFRFLVNVNMTRLRSSSREWCSRCSPSGIRQEGIVLHAQRQSQGARQEGPAGQHPWTDLARRLLRRSG